MSGEGGRSVRLAGAARWAGRILGLLSLGVIGMFVAAEPPWPWRLSMLEGALLACFPVGMAAGLVLAWWREGLGGLVAVLGVLGFYLVHRVGAGEWPRGPWFLIFASPSAFSLASWALRRRGEGGVRRSPRSAPGPTGVGWPG
ncbi:DUF7670 domain-containing protein [Tautonia plasticadhaerens]|uniref:DUF7670 domain-containing protein n=1 Tax=Tautonia plasticadhaerens TaxID=2527974 RepID=A0A518GUY7_9BACT|nr:hypothetical protein [Tautonia plasticadhaerens]QDV32402.1 hypothetical protein ElP_02340 [Tautonia plasticadhaerens]